jgi:DNA repair protein RadC
MIAGTFYLRLRDGDHRLARGRATARALLAHGAAALSDAELLAIFLRVGSKGKSAVDLARELIGRFGGLNRLFAATRPISRRCPAWGRRSMRSCRRSSRWRGGRWARRCARAVPSSPGAVRDYLRLHLAGLQHEVFFALWLDAQNRLIAAEEIFRGTLTQTSVYPREVVKLALRHNAAAVVLAHNHPSGVAEPSRADEVLTSELKQALALVEVRVLDHFIVAAAQSPPLSLCRTAGTLCSRTARGVAGRRRPCRDTALAHRRICSARRCCNDHRHARGCS